MKSDAATLGMQLCLLTFGCLHNETTRLENLDRFMVLDVCLLSPDIDFRLGRLFPTRALPRNNERP